MTRILILGSFNVANDYGTELVAKELAQAWRADGHDILCATHGSARLSQPDSNGFSEIVFLPDLPSNKWVTFSMLSPEAPGFSDLLDTYRPDFVLMVGLGPTVANLAHVRILKHYGTAFGVWHHVAGITCLQNGLRYKDRTPCDGEVRAGRCTRCRLTAAGAPEWLSDAASLWGSARLAQLMPRGVDHIVGGRALAANFKRSLDELSASVDVIMAGAEWVRSVLSLNGFSDHQIKLIRPGVRTSILQYLAQAKAQCANEAPSRLLRCVYWGRIDDIKGVDVAISAMKSIPDEDVTLEIVGDFDPSNRPYHNYIHCLAQNDNRIIFRGYQSGIDLAKTLIKSDVAIIPSSVVETGPLTVFEAHAASLPVLGARTGAIAEVCGNDPSAALFNRNDVGELACLIRTLSKDNGALKRMRAAVPLPRTMRQVAKEALSAIESCAGVRKVGSALAAD